MFGLLPHTAFFSCLFCSLRCIGPERRRFLPTVRSVTTCQPFFDGERCRSRAMRRLEVAEKTALRFLVFRGRLARVFSVSSFERSQYRGKKKDRRCSCLRKDETIPLLVFSRRVDVPRGGPRFLRRVRVVVLSAVEGTMFAAVLWAIPPALSFFCEANQRDISLKAHRHSQNKYLLTPLADQQLSRVFSRWSILISFSGPRPARACLHRTPVPQRPVSRRRALWLGAGCSRLFAV